MRIIVGVSGGIAAYKSCELVSRLVQAHHEVRVVMTPQAAQFVAPLTFRALTGHPAAIAVNDEPEGPLSHITLAQWADALIVAPATASLLARFAAGTADDMLSLVYLSFKGPVLLAPAMEPNMWEHPRTQANLKVLISDGIRLVGPHAGRLASGRSGLGRMAEPEELVEALEDVLTPKDLGGISLVVTAGATWEHFDPVRLLTNPSTGRMGVLIANLAARRGARVSLVCGPRVTEPVHQAVERVDVVSALDMLEACQELMRTGDVFVGAAAVSDFRPEKPLSQKAHKTELGLQWAMAPNPDIIRALSDQYRSRALMVGFAAETDNAPKHAEDKRRGKQLDAVVANLVGSDQGFGRGRYQSWMVTDQGVNEIPGNSKEDTARALLDWVAERIRGDGRWRI